MTLIVLISCLKAFNCKIILRKCVTDEVVDVSGPYFEAVHGGIAVALLGSLHSQNLRKGNLLVVIGASVALKKKKKKTSQLERKHFSAFSIHIC